MALLPGNQEKNEDRDVFDHPQGYHSCYQKVIFVRDKKLIKETHYLLIMTHATPKRQSKQYCAMQVCK